MQILADHLKELIGKRLARNETPTQIADTVKAHLGIEIDRAHVIPYWKGEITLSTQTERGQDKESVQFPADEVKESLFTRMAEGETAHLMSEAAANAPLSIAPDPDQVSDGARHEDAPATQTGRRQDKESVQIPADEAKEPLFTRMPNGEAPGETAHLMSEAAAQAPFSIAPDPVPVPDGARGDDAPATQTGPRQDSEALQIPVDTVDESTLRRMANDEILGALAAQAKARLGIAPDPAPVSNGASAKDPQATQTGRRQDQKTSILTDEMKAFIVRGLARYETPTRVAASAQAQFGIAIDRRQVFAYDPAGSRPPAQRWIDLHAATRAKFLRATAEIGVAQKMVRLRMLDRFANRADEGNYTERCAGFLEQAAKECGGFYERFQRP